MMQTEISLDMSGVDVELKVDYIFVPGSKALLKGILGECTPSCPPEVTIKSLHYGNKDISFMLDELCGAVEDAIYTKLEDQEVLH